MSVSTNTEVSNAARLRLALTRVVRALRRHGGSSLTPSQVSALSTLEDLGAMRISTMADHESLGAPAATRVVASLEEIGLVMRTTDPDDKRASLIDLTDLGRSTLSELWRERTRDINRMLERLTPKERASIEAALAALEKIARD
ncbi:MAG: MarR family winged helix-turn-helix transcriptional regulator [Acidimicrobiales bacterium]